MPDNQLGKQTILITGTSGRIGGALASLLQNEYSIIGIDIHPGPFTTHVVDIQSAAAVNLTKGVYAVIHAAALHVPHMKIFDEEQFWNVNVRGTENLLNGCLKHNVSRFLFASSTSTYGNALVGSQQAIWVTEELQVQPRDIYDETKLAAEALCCAATKSGLLSCLSMRISRCFPEEERLMAIYRLYRGVHVEDVVLAHRLALKTDFVGFDIVNISSQTPFIEDELTELYDQADCVITKHYPEAKSLFENRGWALPKSIDRVYVIERARKLLGYHPNHNFMELFACAPC